MRIWTSISVGPGRVLSDPDVRCGQREGARRFLRWNRWQFLGTDLHLKAAALLHSLARNHALVDGNKRMAWTTGRTFLAINGQWIRAPEDDRFEFVIAVATGALSDLDQISERLRDWSYRE